MTCLAEPKARAELREDDGTGRINIRVTKRNFSLRFFLVSHRSRETGVKTPSPPVLWFRLGRASHSQDSLDSEDLKI